MEQNVHTRNTGRDEWKQHWPLVLTCAAGMAFFSLLSSTMGLFLQPIADDLQWSRTTVMYGMTITALFTVLLSPFAGALIDRYGVRRIALPGLVVVICSLASFSLASGSLVQWTIIWAIYALVLLSIKAMVWTTAIASTFSEARSMAMALGISGTALSQALGPPIAQWLIADYGWRSAFVMQAVGWGGVALILSAFFLYDARDRNRQRREALPSGPVVGDSGPGIALPGLSMGEALRNRAIAKIAIATFLTMVMGVGISVHQVPIIVEAGVSRQMAAYLASLFGVAGILGKVATGWLMDRFDAGVVGALTMTVTACAFALLLESLGSVPLIVLGMVVIGYGSGTKLQICAYLTSCHAGIKNYGKIFGVMSSIIALGGGLGPVTASAVYDMTGSYSAFIFMAIFSTLVAALLLLRLGPTPKTFVESQSSAR